MDLEDKYLPSDDKYLPSDDLIYLLPEECVIHILLQMNISDVLKFCSTNTTNMKFSLQEIIWENVPTDNQLLTALVESVYSGNYPLFKSLLSAVQEREMWYYHSSLENDNTLMELAISSGCKPIIKCLFEINLTESNCSEYIQDSDVEGWDICHLCYLNEPEKFSIGSIEDEILHIYLITIIGGNFDIFDRKHHPAIEIIKLLIEKFRLDELDIWLNRLSNFKPGRHVEYCISCFYEELLATLCRMDEYEEFITYLEKYKLTTGKFENIFKKISEVDYYPFRYIRLINGGNLDDLLKQKGRMSRK